MQTIFAEIVFVLNEENVLKRNAHRVGVLYTLQNVIKINSSFYQIFLYSTRYTAVLMNSLRSSASQRVLIT